MSKRKKTQENTIIHIAEALKLSPATISRALNDHPYVKAQTKKDVLEMAAQLGYRRNLMASGLRNNKTKTVGLIVPRISMFFHAEVITTIQNALHQQGYKLIICQSSDLLELEKELTEILYASRVEALIVACTLQTIDFSHFDKVIDQGLPVIFYDRAPLNGHRATMVVGDDVHGGYLAGKHLIDRGCKRIAHLSGHLSSNLYRNRLSGFRQALMEAGMELGDDQVLHRELSAEEAHKAMEFFFSKEVVPDGVFLANDVSAIAALQFARERGIPVPEKLKIVGYSNDPRTSIISPPISTVEQFPQQVGLRVVTELMALLKAEGNIPETDTAPIVIPVELISRASS
ncbi:PurR [Pedobacter sp. BAL39]|uniref:LacI family DNA-binding transcriptional regulator n=1 Tax=Pedobacter sp. BAL39 TaxID=391596 RepID=UPI000155AC68|nr:LacI family DNA-binding transcriptional regulator [Pedobacter sp. BAL39]EDM34142.1 PurR [Pedobacter sp. BAL39]